MKLTLILRSKRELATIDVQVLVKTAVLVAAIVI